MVDGVNVCLKAGDVCGGCGCVWVCGGGGVGVCGRMWGVRGCVCVFPSLLGLWRMVESA